jgi:ribonuclease HI
MNSESIIIFTDGSSLGNPGPGGFGAIVIAPTNNDLRNKNYEVRELGGREERTTNNRMELLASIEALKFSESLKLTADSYQLLTDSAYLINGITKWVGGWQKNNWKTRLNADVLNKDLWLKLLHVSKEKNISWQYVGGHVGIKGNERCDEIATSFASGKTPELFEGNLEKYPIKNIVDISLDESLQKDKKEKRGRQNTKAYSYVSMLDGKIMTHQTWAECEARVKGKKARFKKSFSKEDENEIISSWKNKK